MGRDTVDQNGDDFEDDYSDEHISEADEFDDDATIECPECGRPIYEDAERCPHCESYVVAGQAGDKPRPLWITITVLLCIYAMLHAYLWPLLFG